MLMDLHWKQTFFLYGKNVLHSWIHLNICIHNAELAQESNRNKGIICANSMHKISFFFWKVIKKNDCEKIAYRAEKGIQSKNAFPVNEISRIH